MTSYLVYTHADKVSYLFVQDDKLYENFDNLLVHKM